MSRGANCTSTIRRRAAVWASPDRQGATPTSSHPNASGATYTTLVPGEGGSQRSEPQLGQWVSPSSIHELQASQWTPLDAGESAVPPVPIAGSSSSYQSVITLSPRVDRLYRSCRFLL